MRGLFISLAAVIMMASGCGPKPAEAPTDASMAAHDAASKAVVKAGTGTGVVKSVDLKTNSVTIAHEPIEAVGWPAMTMTFPVVSMALLDGIAAGQTVSFDVSVTDNKPLITALRK